MRKFDREVHLQQCHLPPFHKKRIKERNNPHLNKDIFIRNTATLLNSFGMARSGPFKGIGFYEGKYKGPIQKLEACWDSINEDKNFQALEIPSASLQAVM